MNPTSRITCTIRITEQNWKLQGRLNSIARAEWSRRTRKTLNRRNTVKLEVEPPPAACNLSAHWVEQMYPVLLSRKQSIIPELSFQSYLLRWWRNRAYSNSPNTNKFQAMATSLFQHSSLRSVLQLPGTVRPTLLFELPSWDLHNFNHKHGEELPSKIPSQTRSVLNQLQPWRPTQTRIREGCTPQALNSVNAVFEGSLPEAPVWIVCLDACKHCLSVPPWNRFAHQSRCRWCKPMK